MSPPPNLLLIHFTRNLRLAANPLLQAAAQYGLPAAALYFLPEYANPRQQFFLRQTLAELSDGLSEYGIPLHVFCGNAVRQLNALMARYPSALLLTAQHIRLAGTDGAERVRYVQEEPLALPVTRYSLENAPPPDFAVYRQAWLRRVRQDAEEGGQTPDWAAVRRAQHGLPQQWRNAPPLPAAPAQILSQAGGETAAQAAWQAFAPKLPHYALMKDFPAQKGTSQLSAALRFGLLPVRQLACAGIGGETPEPWLDSVFYGDYCRRLLPFSDGLWTWQNGALHEICRSAAPPEMPALDSTRAAAFERWRQGMTGVPIIDAAMRTLAGSGWLHPRLRPLAAAFAVSALKLPAAAGEHYFARTLTDYDHAPNRTGWQQAASGRLKNPFAESQNADPGGRFIRSRLPELAHLPDNLIHAPHLAGSGIALNGYPAPIAFA
ncbi:Deoxyribodipyrimidine photo-lyase [Kingella potus]|uniref:Deoxyribodipyrimidine photo-lyase n=1 Tax=Kingella potus TaxID=265175 RepID=A0A377R164_9NEIS|nr:FAD-binding domain-containing protein [Kingella potus]STR01007.1 Deoxyribodipyrimidine photo-lyase [Kingella potus]